MSYPVTDVVQLAPTTTAAVSYAASLAKLSGDWADGDWIFLAIACSNATGGVTLAHDGTTGWSEVVELDVSSGVRMAVYKAKITGGTIGNPTINLSSGTGLWSAFAWIENDADATDPCPANHYGTADGGNATSFSSATLTPGGGSPVDNCRIVYFAATRGSSDNYLRMLDSAVVGDSLLNITDGSVSMAVMVASTSQTTAAATAKTIYNSTTLRAGCITLAIKPGAGGKRAKSATLDITRLAWLGSFGATHDGTLTPVTTSWGDPVSRTISDVAVSTTGATRITNVAGLNEWGTYDNNSCTLSTAGWQGKMLTFSADVDMTGKMFALEWNSPSFASQVGDKGLILVFEDNAGTNWSAFQLSQKIGFQWSNEYGSIIDLENATPFDSGGTLVWSQVRKVTPLLHRSGVSAAARSFSLKNMLLIGKTTMVGGCAERPLDINYLRQALHGMGYMGLVGGEAPAVTIRSDVQIGDGGTTPTYYDATGTLHAFPEAYDALTQREVNIPANQLDFTVKAGSSDTINLTATAVSATQEQNFTIDAASSTSAAYSLVGSSFIGVKWTNNVAINYSGCTFSGCTLVELGGNTITGATVTDPASSAGATESLNNATLEGCTIDISGTSAMYHLALSSAVTDIEINNPTFSGTPAIYSALASGTLTITNDGTGTALDESQVTFVGGSTAVAVIDAPTVTRGLDFDVVLTGSTVKVFATGTQTVIATPTAPNWLWSEGTAGSVTVDYTIQKAGYLPIRVAGVTVTAAVSGGVQVVPVQQIEATAYVVSSGLTFGTNCYANPTTKKFGLTVASTLQNLYSRMMESWITEATLQNKPFPLVANGPNSFALTDGWEWDLTTYANSITLLSRDGMRYRDASGTTTAMWAALLSVGVPTGFQVRYQQQDGLGTTDAQNTGNIDQLIQIYGDASHGNFDYTGWLVLKCQEEGYDQAEAVVLDIYPALDDQLFVVGLTPLANGIAAGVTDATVTVTAEAAPVLWNGSYFSTTIKDTTDTHSGLEIMQAVRAENEFNWSDLVRPNGDKFKTVTGNFYGDTFATPAGVRVVKADGATPHPDFNLFNDDSGSAPYTPPVVAPIEWAGALDGTTVLLYNDVGGGAGVIIDTQTITGAGGYSLDVTLPSVDVAVGDPLRVRFGHKEYYAGELQGTMTETGLTFVGSMTLHPVYAAWGLDGAVYDQGHIPPGPYVMDETFLQVDIAAGATTGLKTQLGAWTQYLMTLPAGLAAFYGAWDLLAVNQIRQNVDVINVKIDVPTAGALFEYTDNDVNYYRSDFTFPGNVEAGHGLVAMTYNASIFVPPPTIISGESVVTGTPDTVADAVRVELAAELAATLRAEKWARNKQVLDPVTGSRTVYDDDGTTVLGQGSAYMDTAGAEPYDGSGPVHRTERLA